jgi:hypothetical protein
LPAPPQQRQFLVAATNGVTSGSWRASKRLSAPLSRSTREAMTARRGLYLYRPEILVIEKTARETPGAGPDQHRPWHGQRLQPRREVRGSPTTACSCVAPSPIRSPTTTSPVPLQGARPRPSAAHPQRHRQTRPHSNCR